MVPPLDMKEFLNETEKTPLGTFFIDSTIPIFIVNSKPNRVKLRSTLHF